MKTTFIYGIGMAVASFVLGLILFFAGFHSDAEKLATAQLVGSLGALVITVVGLIMAMKARRDEFTAEEGFGYGRALGTGTLTALWSSLTGAVLSVVYAVAINPGMQEVIIEGEIAKMEEQGLPASTIEQAEGVIKFMTSPAMMAVSNFIFGIVVGFVISLILAAFLKRNAVDGVAPPPPPAEA